MADHHLKTWPDQFAAVADGRKRYEIRRNDRGFRVGDRLYLHEWIPESVTYTGRVIVADVTYMTDGGEWGLPPELCVMSIEVRRG